MGLREGFTTRLFYPGGKKLLFPLNKKLGGIQRLSGRFVEKKAFTIVRYEFIDHPVSGMYNHSTWWQTSGHRHWEIWVINNTVGRDSSGGIATRWGLYGPGIESRCGAKFSAPVHTDPEAHPASYTMGTGSIPVVKRPELGVHPTPFSAEVKERVELYLYSPSGPSWPIIGWIYL